MPVSSRPLLSIDLLAIVANYRLIVARLKQTEVAAVVKADAYGLGARAISRALAAAGCKTFFVAHVEEGAELRSATPNAAIYILHGYAPQHRTLFAEHK